MQPYKREERKSVGVERTFRDKWEDEEILSELANIAQELEEDLKRLQYSGKTVTVKYKLHTYECMCLPPDGADSAPARSRALSVKKYISTKDEILPVSLSCYAKLTTDCPRPHEEGAAGTHPPARHPALEPEGPDSARDDGYQGGQFRSLPASTDPQFFAKSASSSPKKAKLSAKSPAPELDLSQIEEAVEASSSAPGRERETSAPGVPGEALDTDPSPSNPGPSCPICQRALGLETSNAQLNEHIDLCLNRGVEGIETSPVKRKAETTPQATQATQASQGKRKKKRKEGPTVLDWLKRGN